MASVPGNKIGATLTFGTANLSEEWEPKAATPFYRLEMLYRAQVLGITTWASIEPVIIPEQSLAIMESAIPYVDEFKIGKLNHHHLAQSIDWRDFARRAQDLMEKHGKRYVFKAELRRCL